MGDTPNKGGRPPKLIANEATLETLRGLGMIQCTVKEAAAVLRVAQSTFEEFLNKPGVREAFHEGQAEGRTSLRRKQFALADTNASMAIFLGKNYLGQTDKVETEHSGAVKLVGRIELVGVKPDGDSPASAT